MATPDGPEASPWVLMPEGRPERSVRRFPFRSTIEIRPLLGVVVPLSATIRLFLLENVIPSGPSRPEISSVTGHCAHALTVVRIANAKAATEVIANWFREYLFCIFISMGPFTRFCFV